MKLITVELPDSYLELLEKSGICVGVNRPEHLRLEIRENLRQELRLAGELEYELEGKKSAGFFDSCINCGGILHNKARKSHLFHKGIEIFVLRFCCACYTHFKDIPFKDFPPQLIDNIRKKTRKYMKNRD